MASHKPICGLRAKQEQKLIFRMSHNGDFPRGQLRVNKNGLSGKRLEMTEDAFVRRKLIFKRVNS